MSKQTNPDHQRIFWQTGLKHIPHHSLLVLARKRNNIRLAQRLDARLKPRLAVAAPPPPATQVLDAYIQTAHNTVFWHGTGRLQYQGDGVVDTFADIVGTGSLTPKRDAYAIILTGKEMDSLSATTVRIIARSYADTHGKGAAEAGRYGSSLWWVAYYYNLCYFELFVKHGLTVAKNWTAFNRASANTGGERTWGKKVHSHAKSVWDTFSAGSDIPGNYPILFGIRNTVHTAQLPRSMQKWEVRITKPVTFDDLTHLEVPGQKIDEVKQLLAEHGRQLPVYALETGEYVASQQSLMELLYPQRTDA